MKILSICLLVFLPVAACLAQDSTNSGPWTKYTNTTDKATDNPTPTLDQLQKIKEIDKNIDQLKDLQRKLDGLGAMVDRGAREKYVACMQAFGSDPFCNCLQSECPIVINFAGYVHIVTSTKAELGYDKLSKDDKELVDAVFAVREHCVAAMLSATNNQSDVASHLTPAKTEK